MEDRTIMTFKEFQALTAEHLKLQQEVLTRKGKFYNPNAARLESFHNTGQAKQETPERALWGMFYKHITGIQSAIYGLDRGVIPDYYRTTESLLDMTTYPILLKGLFLEHPEFNRI